MAHVVFTTGDKEILVQADRKQLETLGRKKLQHVWKIAASVEVINKKEGNFPMNKGLSHYASKIAQYKTELKPVIQGLILTQPEPQNPLDSMPRSDCISGSEVYLLIDLDGWQLLGKAVIVLVPSNPNMNKSLVRVCITSLEEQYRPSFYLEDRKMTLLHDTVVEWPKSDMIDLTTYQRYKNISQGVEHYSNADDFLENCASSSVQASSHRGPEVEVNEVVDISAELLEENRMLKRKFEEMEQKVVSTQKKNIELQHILNSYIQSTKEIATKYRKLIFEEPEEEDRPRYGFHLSGVFYSLSSQENRILLGSRPAIIFEMIVKKVGANIGLDVENTSYCLPGYKSGGNARVPLDEKTIRLLVKGAMEFVPMYKDEDKVRTWLGDAMSKIHKGRKKKEHEGKSSNTTEVLPPIN